MKVPDPSSSDPRKDSKLNSTITWIHIVAILGIDWQSHSEIEVNTSTTEPGTTCKQFQDEATIPAVTATIPPKVAWHEQPVAVPEVQVNVEVTVAVDCKLLSRT